MNSDDYDDPVMERHWCDACRQQVIDYLESQGLIHGEVGEWPAWHVAPYVSVWAVESLVRPRWVGWWVICGDLPTDYVSADSIKHPRQAMQAIAERWKELSEYMARGEEYPGITLGPPETWPELAPLLRTRSELLTQFAEDDSLWEE